MSGGSGNDNLLNMGLMIAAGIAAPALAPMLMTGGAAGLGLGATAATAVTGATLGGLAGAATGKDPLQSALMGGLGGAASGYFGGVNPAESGSMLASGPTASNAGLSSLPTPAVYPTPQATFTPPNFEYLPSGEMTVSSNPIANLPSTTGPSQDVLKSMAQQADASRIAAQPQLFGMPKAEAIGGGIAGINEILSAKPTSAYVPPDSKYKGGSLANFRYDPDRYTPADVPPLPYAYRQMAMGGLAMGGIPPQTNFANPSSYEQGTSQYSMATDPMSGNIANRMARGGLASISNFAGGGVTGSGQMQLNVPINIDDAGNSPYTPAGGGFGGGGGYAPPGGPQGGSAGSLASLLKGAQGQSPAGAAPQAQGAQAQGAQMNMQDNAQSAQGMSADVNGFTPIQTNQGTLLAGQFLQGLSGIPQDQKAGGAMGAQQYDLSQQPGGNYKQYGAPPMQQGIGMASGGDVSMANRLKNLGQYQKANSNANLTDMMSILGGKPYTNPNQSTFDPNTYQASTVTKPYLEREQYARGGIASLGMYSDGGRLLRGPGDGVSDNIPAKIGQRQEARLADGEFVVPARIVSELGNGSTEAGAKRLYKMMDNVQNARKKSIGKGKFAQNTKAYKHLPA